MSSSNSCHVYTASFAINSWNTAEFKSSKYKQVFSKFDSDFFLCFTLFLSQRSETNNSKVSSSPAILGNKNPYIDLGTIISVYREKNLRPSNHQFYCVEFIYEITVTQGKQSETYYFIRHCDLTKIKEIKLPLQNKSSDFDNKHIEISVTLNHEPFDIFPKIGNGLENEMQCYCFMNSTLQMLFHIPALQSIILNIPIPDPENPKKQILKELQNLFFNLSKGGDAENSTPKKIKTDSLRKAFGWNPNLQIWPNDPQEFLNNLLESIKFKLEKPLRTDDAETLEVLSHLSSQFNSLYMKETIDNETSFDNFINTKLVNKPLAPILILEIHRRWFPYRDTFIVRSNTGKDVFYELTSVLIFEQQKINSIGHCYLYQRPSVFSTWYRYSDSDVVFVKAHKALLNYGYFAIQENSGGPKSCPLYLVYIRHDMINEIYNPKGLEEALNRFAQSSSINPVQSYNFTISTFNNWSDLISKKIIDFQQMEYETFNLDDDKTTEDLFEYIHEKYKIPLDKIYLYSSSLNHQPKIPFANMTNQFFYSQKIGSLSKNQLSLFLLNDVKSPKQNPSKIIYPIFWKQGNMKALKPIMVPNIFSLGSLIINDDGTSGKMYLEEILGEIYNKDIHYHFYSIKHDNSLIEFELDEKIQDIFLIFIADEDENLENHEILDKSWEQYAEFQREQINTFSFFFQMHFKSKKLYISSFDYSITILDLNNNFKPFKFDDFEITVPDDMLMSEFKIILARHIIPDISPDNIVIKLYPNPTKIFIAEDPIKFEDKVSKTLKSRGTHFKLSVFFVDRNEQIKYYIQRVSFTKRIEPKFIYELMLPYSTQITPDIDHNENEAQSTPAFRHISFNMASIEKGTSSKNCQPIKVIRDVLNKASVNCSCIQKIPKKSYGIAIYSPTTLQVIEEIYENRNPKSICRCINFKNFNSNRGTFYSVFYGVTQNQFKVNQISSQYFFLIKDEDELFQNFQDMLCGWIKNYQFDIVTLVTGEMIIDEYLTSLPIQSEDSFDDCRIDYDKLHQIFERMKSTPKQLQNFCILVYTEGTDLNLEELLPPVPDDCIKIMN